MLFYLYHSHLWQYPIIYYQSIARQVMPEKAWAYYSSAADDEITIRENHAAYHRSVITLIAEMQGYPTSGYASKVGQTGTILDSWRLGRIIGFITPSLDHLSSLISTVSFYRFLAS